MWGEQYWSVGTGIAWEVVEVCPGMTLESVRTVWTIEAVEVRGGSWYEEDPKQWETSCSLDHKSSQLQIISGDWKWKKLKNANVYF